MRNKLLLSVSSCGNCLHFNREKHTAKKELCSRLGKKPYGKICQLFKQNPFVLSSQEGVSTVSKLLKAVPSKDYDALARLLMTANETVINSGFNLFDKVVFKTYISDSKDDVYLSDYVIGMVYGATESSIYISTKTKFPIAVVTNKDRVSLLSGFSSVKATLIKNDRLIRPETPSKFKKSLSNGVTINLEKLTTKDFVILELSTDNLRQSEIGGVLCKSKNGLLEPSTRKLDNSTTGLLGGGTISMLED